MKQYTYLFITGLAMAIAMLSGSGFALGFATAVLMFNLWEMGEEVRYRWKPLDPTDPTDLRVPSFKRVTYFDTEE